MSYLPSAWSTFKTLTQILALLKILVILKVNYFPVAQYIIAISNISSIQTVVRRHNSELPVSIPVKAGLGDAYDEASGTFHILNKVQRDFWSHFYVEYFLEEC